MTLIDREQVDQPKLAADRMHDPILVPVIIGAGTNCRTAQRSQFQGDAKAGSTIGLVIMQAVMPLLLLPYWDDKARLRH